jgi:biotin synthase
MADLLEKLYRNNGLDRGELIELLDMLDDDETMRNRLYRYALATRMCMYGNRVFLRGLIEFSSFCRKDCLYCGLRRSNGKAARYRMTPDDIIACCGEGYRLGFRTFVLQSGEDVWYTADRLESLIRQIKGSYPDAAITLSVGERPREEYERFFRAGADRYLLRHETASLPLYKRLHPDASFTERIRCLRDLQEIGYQVGAGFMVGLPGQTNEDLAEDLLFLQSLGPDMAGIGPFIPHSRTPLAGERGGTVEKTRTMVALTRIMLPEANIPATTALGTLQADGRELALLAGANVMMPNLTPTVHRPKYALYENKICSGDEASVCLGCLEMRIRMAGFEVDMGRGDSRRFLARQASAAGSGAQSL